VNEARAVIARLDRIEAMERAREPAELVLGQLALLVAETERWLETERTAGVAARKALERCLQALEQPLAGVQSYCCQHEEAFGSLKTI
jgi:glutathione S-transferase